MGNVVSAVLMYALQVAWMCQRLIDQDYRQNHGSRLYPISGGKCDTELDVFLPNSASTPILSRSPHHRSKPVKPGKQKKEEFDRVRQRFQSFRSQHGVRKVSEVALAMTSTESLDKRTADYVSSVRTGVSLRRAFSDINVSSRAAQHDDNHNYLQSSACAAPISSTDQAILRLVVSRGCMPNKRHDTDCMPDRRHETDLNCDSQCDMDLISDRRHETESLSEERQDKHLDPVLVNDRLNWIDLTSDRRHETDLTSDRRDETDLTLDNRHETDHTLDNLHDSECLRETQCDTELISDRRQDVHVYSAL